MAVTLSNAFSFQVFTLYQSSRELIANFIRNQFARFLSVQREKGKGNSGDEKASLESFQLWEINLDMLLWVEPKIFAATTDFLWGTPFLITYYHIQIPSTRCFCFLSSDMQDNIQIVWLSMDFCLSILTILRVLHNQFQSRTHKIVRYKNIWLEAQT